VLGAVLKEVMEAKRSYIVEDGNCVISQTALQASVALQFHKANEISCLGHLFASFGPYTGKNASKGT